MTPRGTVPRGLGRMNRETTMRKVTITGREFGTAHDALVEINWRGDRVVSVGRKYMVITEAEWNRLCGLGVRLTQWCHHEPTGRIMSIPA